MVVIHLTWAMAIIRSRIGSNFSLLRGLLRLKVVLEEEAVDCPDTGVVVDSTLGGAAKEPEDEVVQRERQAELTQDRLTRVTTR